MTWWSSNFLQLNGEIWGACLNLVLCLGIGVVLIPFRPTLKGTRIVSILGSLSFLASALWLFVKVLSLGSVGLQAGAWPAPFGISLFIDPLGATMILITAVMGLCGNLACQATLRKEIEERYFHVFFHFMLAGCVGAFSTGDLFNLFVWFEVILISSFALLTLSESKSLRAGAVKYVTLSLFSSFLFLMGLALIYHSTGSLQMHDLAERQLNHGPLLKLAGAFVSLAFLMKAGAFPLYQWLPASYPYLSGALLSVFSALLTKVALFALIRTFSSGVLPLPGQNLLVWMALGTMLFGVLAAIYQNDIKKILSAHVISQLGYMLLGFALGTQFGLAAAIAYMILYIPVKSSLFLVAAWIEELYQSCDLKVIDALKLRHPLMSVMFALAAVALIGAPPLSVFWGKLRIIQSSVQEQNFIALIVALAVGFLTLFSMVKIWLEAFLAPAERVNPHKTSYSLSKRGRWLLVPIVVLNSLAIFLGLYFEQVWQLSEIAAHHIMRGAR